MLSSNMHKIVLKWGVFDASVLLNEHGHPLFYFKIEVLISLFFQRNYLKLNISVIYSGASPLRDLYTNERI